MAKKYETVSETWVSKEQFDKALMFAERWAAPKGMVVSSKQSGSGFMIIVEKEVEESPLPAMRP